MIRGHWCDYAGEVLTMEESFALVWAGRIVDNAGICKQNNFRFLEKNGGSFWWTTVLFLEHLPCYTDMQKIPIIWSRNIQNLG